MLIIDLLIGILILGVAVNPAMRLKPALITSGQSSEEGIQSRHRSFCRYWNPSIAQILDLPYAILLDSKMPPGISLYQKFCS